MTAAVLDVPEIVVCCDCHHLYLDTEDGGCDCEQRDESIECTVCGNPHDSTLFTQCYDCCTDGRECESCGQTYRSLRHHNSSKCPTCSTESRVCVHTSDDGTVCGAVFITLLDSEREACGKHMGYTSRCFNPEPLVEGQPCSECRKTRHQCERCEIVFCLDSSQQHMTRFCGECRWESAVCDECDGRFYHARGAQKQTCNACVNRIKNERAAAREKERKRDAERERIRRIGRDTTVYTTAQIEAMTPEELRSAILKQNPRVRYGSGWRFSECICDEPSDNGYQCSWCGCWLNTPPINIECPKCLSPRPDEGWAECILCELRELVNNADTTCLSERDDVVLKIREAVRTHYVVPAEITCLLTADEIRDAFSAAHSCEGVCLDSPLSDNGHQCGVCCGIRVLPNFGWRQCSGCDTTISSRGYRNSWTLSVPVSLCKRCVVRRDEQRREEERQDRIREQMARKEQKRLELGVTLAKMDFPYFRRRVIDSAQVTKVTKRDRRVVWDGMLCVYCGGEAHHADHLYPKARGGHDHLENLVPACNSCNSSKHNKLLTEWDMNKVRHALNCGGEFSELVAKALLREAHHHYPAIASGLNHPKFDLMPPRDVPSLADTKKLFADAHLDPLVAKGFLESRRGRPLKKKKKKKCTRWKHVSPHTCRWRYVT